MPLTERVLPNGIRLITEPIATTKTVAIGFWFSMGSRDEKAGECGITHFAEHLLFKGTSSMSAFDLARFFDRVGGYVNAFTERETLCLHCVVPAEYATQAIAILSDMAWDSVSSDEDIARERSVIESEILAALDDPEETGMDAAMACMYGEHPIARPIAGTRSAVQSLGNEAIRAFLVGALRRDPPLIAVAGNVDRDAIESVVGERTRAITFAHAPLPSAPPLWKSGAFYPVSGFSQSQIYLSYPLPTSADPVQWHAWAVINAMAGNSVSSRLFQSLRERNGLCYSVYSAYSYGRDSAVWGAYAATPPELTVKACELLRREIGNMASFGFTEEECSDSSSHVIGELLLSSEDTENRMKRLARQYLFGKKVYTVEECIAIVKGLRRDDLAAVAQSVLRAERASLVVYAQKKVIKECARTWR